MTRDHQRHMPHLFSPEGEAVLAAVMTHCPLVALDFDGTLAPIVATPDLARVPLPVSSRLRKLRDFLQVAIVTGRAVDDVRGRLDFEPHFVIGNHGAEAGFEERERALQAGLDPVRELLARRAGELAEVGVTVEDKRLSLALHYRLSRNADAARKLIAELVPGDFDAVHVLPGKMVANIVHADAPDKAQALLDLVKRCAADCAIFVGDDANDEPVFVAAPEGWLTVRVGRDAPHSAAAFYLDGSFDLALLVDRLLRHVEASSHHRK
jgi:trehalose 6-phosphate phosphatase